MHQPSRFSHNLPSPQGYAFSFNSFGCDPVHRPGHVYGPVIYDYYVLQYCLVGCGVVTVNRRPIPLRAGDCIVYFPGQLLVERADSANPWGFQWLSISGSSAANFFEQVQVTPDEPLISCQGNSKVRELMEKLVKLSEVAGIRRELTQASLLFALLDCLAEQRLGRDMSLARAKAHSDYVTDALRYIDQNYSKPTLRCEDIARHVGLERSYFSFLFHRQTGWTLQEYIMRYRISKACDLLALPRATVAAVAYSVGYEPVALYKAFKRLRGCTPSEYRRAHLAGGE